MTMLASDLYSCDQSTPNHNDHLVDWIFDLTDLRPLVLAPLARSRRLRYTCATVSTGHSPIIITTELAWQLIALGTTTGSVYLFRRLTTPTPTTTALSASASIASSTSSILTTDNSLSPRKTTELTNQEHYASIIHEDLFGSISSLQFGPIFAGDYPRPPSSATSSFNENHHDDESDTLLEPPPPPSPPPPPPVLLAIGTSKGCLMIVEIVPQPTCPTRPTLIGQFPFLARSSQQQSNDRWKVHYQCQTFTTNSITILRWDDSHRLFIVDSAGRVYVLHNICDLDSLMIPPSPTLLFDLKGISIHQFEIGDQLLTISTEQGRVYLFDLLSAKLTVVGKPSQKQRKDQPSGVCLLRQLKLEQVQRLEFSDDDEDDQSDDSRNDSIYEDTYYNQPFTPSFQVVSEGQQLFVTRPKCRVWVANTSGDILFTQQFKEVVEEIDSNPIYGDSTAIGSIFEKVHPEMANSHFASLQPMYWYSPSKSLFQITAYLIAYSVKPRSRIFVIDPAEQTIIAASPVVRGHIVDLQCVGKSIYVSYVDLDSTLAMFALNLTVKDSIVESRATMLSSYSSTEQLSSLIQHLDQNHCCRPESIGSCLPESSELCVQESTRFLLQESSQPSSAPCLSRELSTEPGYESIEFEWTREYLSLVAQLDRGIECGQCRLPVPVSFDTVLGQFDKLNLELDSKQASLFPLARLAQSNANWLLYYYVMGKLEQAKLCLYFTLLFAPDGDCRFVMKHKALFGEELFASQSLWLDTICSLSECLFRKPNITKLATLLGSRKATECSGSADRCRLCQIQSWLETKSDAHLFHWFENSLLRYSLLYCAPSAIVGELEKILATIQSTTSGYFLSAKFYLLLFRFKLLNLSIVSTPFLNRFTNFQSKQITRPPGGGVLDFRSRICAKCRQILFRNSRIQYFSTCDHAFHYDCLLTTYCTQCN